MLRRNCNCSISIDSCNNLALMNVQNIFKLKRTSASSRLLRRNTESTNKPIVVIHLGMWWIVCGHTRALIHTVYAYLSYLDTFVLSLRIQINTDWCFISTSTKYLLSNHSRDYSVSSMGGLGSFVETYRNGHGIPAKSNSCYI